MVKRDRPIITSYPTTPFLKTGVAFLELAINSRSACRIVVCAINPPRLELQHLSDLYCPAWTIAIASTMFSPFDHA